MHDTPPSAAERGLGPRRPDLPAAPPPPPPPAAPGVRVAYILKRYPRLSQTFVLNEMLELERQGVEVVVIARDGSGGGIAPPATKRLRARVHYLRDLEPREERWDNLAAALLRDLRVDHVHAHFATWAAGAAMRAARRAGIPYSFTAHATDIYRDTVDTGALVERMPAASFVVTVSDCTGRRQDGLLAGAGLQVRVVLPCNGLDLERLRPAA